MGSNFLLKVMSAASIIKLHCKHCGNTWHVSNDAKTTLPGPQMDLSLLAPLNLRWAGQQGVRQMMYLLMTEDRWAVIVRFRHPRASARQMQMRRTVALAA